MGGGASQTAGSAVSFQMWAEWEGLNESQWEEPVSQNNQVCLKKFLKARQQHSFPPATAQQLEV